MLQGIEKRLGLPPLEQALGLVQGPTGKRIESLLGRLERLAKDGSLPQMIALLKMVQEMDKQGTLQRLESVLKLLPTGKSAQSSVALVQLLAQQVPKLDRLIGLLEAMAAPPPH